MKPIKGIISCAVLSFAVLLTGCEKTDIHKIEPVSKELYQKTIPETFEVHRGDMTPTIRLKLTQNSLRYYNYSVDLDDLEFDELKVANGDFVKAGQVLCVFKSDKIEKKVTEARETLETDKLLLEHVKKLKSINFDPEKTDPTMEEFAGNIAIGKAYDDQIASIEDDIKLKEIELMESQRDLDKCIVKAREDGVITYVSEAIANGVVIKGKDILTEASGDVGFTTEVKNSDYEFEVGAVYKAQSPTMEFDVEITQIEENNTGTKTLHLKPVSDDVGYVSSEKFEVVIPLETMKDVVYVEERYVYTAVNEKRFVYVVDENGFRNPVYVEVDSVVDGMAVIKSGLKGGEEVAGK
ncbi:MAG: efflux RND transporter periplasmic adaptor subunit [Lachnospiraceae bacterium]|nr:efflux RND transporter periplasmic adaptor subunit [Lachnospiraceae bacterium]